MGPTYLFNMLKRNMVIVVAASLLPTAGCGEGNLPKTRAVGQRKLGCPDAVWLSRVNRDGLREGTLRVHNPTHELEEVARLETSCPCLSISPQKFCLKPAEAIDVRLLFSPDGPQDDPGPLSIEAIGKSASDTVLFKTKVLLFGS